MFAEAARASQSPGVNRALRVLTIALVVTACAPSGDNPLSRLTTWEAPSGDYRIRYQSPPWQILSESTDGAFFNVQSTLQMTGRVDGGAGKYELRTSRVGRSVAEEMDREVRDARRTGGREIVDGPREIVTDEGVVGSELITFDEPDPFERYRRVVAFPLEGGRTLRLDFESTPDIDTPEVEAMIRHVGIGARP